MKPFSNASQRQGGCITPFLRRSALALALAAAASGAVEAEVLKADFNGDGLEDLVVGVPGNSTGGKKNAGSVTVWYGGREGVLTEIPQQSFTQDTPAGADTPAVAGVAEENDRFGSVLAVGDFNGDSFDDLAVGVPFEDLAGVGADGQGRNAGAVNILYGTAFGLTTRGNRVLTLSNLNPNDNLNRPGSRFGSSLATGDLNGDGFADLVVGVPFWDDAVTGENAGLVAVFFGTSAGLKDQLATYLTQNQPRVPGKSEPGNRFGVALAVADFNRDGVDDMAVGIPGDNLGTRNDTGSVVILYRRAGGFLDETEVLRDKFVAAGDRFGRPLTAGDFNGDGNPDLAIGHPGEDASATNSGAVTVLFGNGSSPGFVAGRQYWPADVFNLPGKPEDFDGFGSSLAAADFDGNGADDLAIGTPFESQERIPTFPRHSTGQVTVLYGSSHGLTVTSRSDWHQDKPGVETDPGEYEYFGDALSVGDFNQDGFGDLVVGVPGQDVDTGRKQEDAGIVHVFYGTAEGLSTDPALGPQVFDEGIGTAGPTVARTGDNFGSALP